MPMYALDIVCTHKGWLLNNVNSNAVKVSIVTSDETETAYEEPGQVFPQQKPKDDNNIIIIKLTECWSCLGHNQVIRIVAIKFTWILILLV